VTLYIERPELEQDLLRRLDSDARLIFLVGPHGVGKTAILQRLQSELAGSVPTALVQVEPIAASPEILCERFLELAREVIPSTPSKERPSYSHLLASLARSNSEAILLLDELTELRTLSYFPGVDKPLEGFLVALIREGPRSFATSRFPYWLKSHLLSLPETLRSRIAVVEVPPMTGRDLEAWGLKESGRLVAATGGLPAHLQPLLLRMVDGESLDQALACELSAGGHVDAECRASLGELLHRARGYGACKAVLHVLAAEESLTLSEIARRLKRTAGSTRDYLRWLEEVELIRVRDKRFTFVDPVLRLWLRLYGRGRPPTEEEIDNEVASYIQGIPEDKVAPPGVEKTPVSRKDEELIEID
jgi:hypothetical protein